MKPKTGKEPFHQQAQPLSFTLLDFWAWSQSDLTNNTLRGIIAEFIVMKALGISQPFRIEWDAYDLITETGLKIEVKSAAYLQSWHQEKLSKISFGIAPTIAWDAKTNTYATQKKRWADCYIFCLLHHQDKSNIDPLNMDQWTFYVLPTAILDKEKPNQGTITLGVLQKLQPIQCRFEKLKTVIQELSRS